MTDTFQNYTSALESPAEYHFIVIPSDTTDMDVRPRALRIGTAGTIVLRDKHGADISYAVQAGEILPVRAMRVLASGTTAGNIVGWY